MNLLFKHTYFNTYYYANIVSNILTDECHFNFTSRFFEQESVIDELIKPFQKRSAFHLFIEHVISDFFDNDMHDHDEKDYNYCTLHSHAKFIPYAEMVLESYGMSNGTFNSTDMKSYDEVEKYHTELYESGILLDLYETIADEVFYVMFNNREILLHFNHIMAKQVLFVDFSNPWDSNNNDENNTLKYFTKTGRLKRVRIPGWCKKAVYFRDRGRCCICNKDLSGTLSINNQQHYDHIIPLAQGGLNDIANIQLLCDSCNAVKGGHKIETSDWYEKWY